MEPGIYPGVAFEDYLKIDAINKSGLDQMARTPRHFWAKFLSPDREPEKPSDAFRLGHAIHAAALEPKKFAEKFRVAPDPKDYPNALVTADDYKNACKSAGLPVSGSREVLKARLLENKIEVQFFEEIEKELSQFEILSVKEMRVCLAIAKNMQSSAAAQILFSTGTPEAVMIWIDPETGLKCKARADWLTFGENSYIFDLKSTQDASPDAFSRSIFNYGYHRQAAWYLDGFLHASGGQTPAGFIFGAWETFFPFEVAYHLADEAMIERGREENRKYLNLYAECRRNNEWPGYPETINPISLPPWAKPKSDDITVF
jgi:hypothetical protein